MPFPFGGLVLSMQRSIFLACLALAACAAGGVADPFYAHVNPSLRTAYHSRARIVEDRPMLMTLTRAGFDTKNIGDFGKVGFWNWTVSSLTDRRATRHRHALNEMDYGVFWTYVWDFGRLDDTWRGWGLTTDVMKDWLTFEGYSHPARLAKTNASISEWRLAQSLDNPYLTPFYLVRRGLHPHDWLYVQTGVRRVFALTDALSLTPLFFAECGSENHFERRYGAKHGGGRYRSGLMALNLSLELAWRVSDAATLYAGVHQFGIAHDDARARVKANPAPNARRDLTIGTVGVRFRF